MNFAGAYSRNGRRTATAGLGGKIAAVDGSLRDVKVLVEKSASRTILRYREADARAMRRVVETVLRHSGGSGHKHNENRMRSNMSGVGHYTTNLLLFLHIGKNAGTQITYISQQLARAGIQIKQSSHDTKLKQIEMGVPYFFSIRDPISRFRSGFYSRKRKGQPRLLVEWSTYEAYAFEKFEHANDLAESLFRKDERGFAATRAITSIRHTAKHQVDWFESVLNFELRPPVWIIRQEMFREDLVQLLKKLNIGVGIDDLIIATDPKLAHQNNYAGVPELSELARANLRSWYSRDFAFYDLCVDWINRNRGLDE